MDMQTLPKKTATAVMAEALRLEIETLAADYSIETLPSESIKIPSYRDILPIGKTVNIAYLPGSDFGLVARTAARLRDEGFEPVPHLPARAFRSTEALEDALRLLHGEAGIVEVLAIAGGIATPRGPFSDTMSLLETGLLQKYGIACIGVGGHPEGSPDIDNTGLSTALRAKNDFAVGSRLAMHLTTQFCLDAAPVFAWDVATRMDGITLPIHVGLPGVTTLKSLMRFAKICGVGPSRRALFRDTRKLVRLSAISYPDRLVTAIARQRLADPACRIRRLHFFPFGGLARTANWLARIASGEIELNADLSGFTLLD